MTELEPLIESVERNDEETVREILDRDPSLVHRQDGSGATPLHYAAFNGSREIVKLLIEKGADVNARDGQFGATPAGWAIEYLRELGGQLAIEIEDLAYAIESRDTRWVKRFLQRFPALRTAVYRDQKTFRELALDSGDAELAELFSDRPV